MSSKTIAFEATFDSYRSNKGGRKLTLEVSDQYPAAMAMIEASEGYRLKVTVKILTAEIIGKKA